MKKAKKLTYSLITLFFVAGFACNIPLPFSRPRTDNIPQFNADSAYLTVKYLDTAIGARPPNTPQHRKARDFIVNKLKSYGLQVITQDFTALRYDGQPLEMTNIIAVFAPEKKKRIMLFTHWDTRFVADYETDSTLREQPVPGANDGGSGVAVLLEIARLIVRDTPDVGIDFVFFDGEDQGPPENLNYTRVSDLKYWSLGSQYWVKNLGHNYKPLYAVGVDMVGYKNAKFAIEDYSLYYYGYLVKKIWSVASYLGYDTLFVDVRTQGIFNDHVIISENSPIRAVMIIENSPHKRFGNYWHTTRDNISIIDPQRLKAVGQTLLTVIYNE